MSDSQCSYFEVKPVQVPPTHEAHLTCSNGLVAVLYASDEGFLRSAVEEFHEHVANVDFFSVATVARQPQGRP